MNQHTPQADLTNCDREPIHALGAIQPFGGLIAVTNDWMIAHRSANAAQILGLDEELELGAPLSHYFTSEAMTALGQAAGAIDDATGVERMFGQVLVPEGPQMDYALHCSGSLTLIEFEPNVDGQTGSDLLKIQPILRRLEKAESIEALCQAAAEEMRGLLGFDRVMVYRFAPDLSGDVIAESVAEGIDSYLGLRYPKTDIPAQARELYVRNRFRIISDVRGEAVPIEPARTSTGGPLDLSMSTLRAVSPIHLEYLRNMGVDASLSISIVVEGKLWGLFACHHYSPRVLPFPVRTLAETFSELFSLSVDSMRGKERAETSKVAEELNDKLMRSVAGNKSLLEVLPGLRPLLVKWLPHDGLTVFIEDGYRALGSAPNEEEFRALLPSLNATASSQITATDRLLDIFPAADAFEDRAVGALIIPVSRSPRDYIVLWRKEVAQTVTWGGNPDKPVETGPNGDRLTPRESFEAWKVSVEGRSQGWSESELRLADRVRVSLLEIILRVTDDLVTERARAQAQQELLIAELNHRVRNILNLIRGLVNQSRGDATDVEQFTKVVSGRISALASAHDNITKQNWAPASVTDLIRSEADAYVTDNLDRVSITGHEARITPEGYTVLALVIHEMMTNSVKYGALCDSTGKLDVNITCDEGGMKVRWRERGGPPVKPPTRRGFGSTIVEKSIPFEMNGSADIEFKLGGVEAEFWIPGRYIEFDGSRIEEEVKAKAATQESGEVSSKRRPSRALLVEDAMIIAMDTEECLLDLGIDEVVIEGSVAAALRRLTDETFDIAILDYNLGTESSERVAEKLVELGTPFWLATGYNEMADRLDEIGAEGLLVKPYGGDELQRMLDEYATA